MSHRNLNLSPLEERKMGCVSNVQKNPMSLIKALKRLVWNRVDIHGYTAVCLCVFVCFNGR